MEQLKKLSLVFWSMTGIVMISLTMGLVTHFKEKVQEKKMDQKITESSPIPLPATSK